MKLAEDMRKKPIAVRVVRSAIAVFVILVLLECSMALLGIPGKGLYSGDIGHYWALTPGYSGELPHGDREFAVEISELGIRDDGPPVDGPWVLALGCSTTFGWGVESNEIWTEKLEMMTGVPVVNAGVPGHSTEQGLVFAREFLELQPDVVIFGWGVRDAQLAQRPDSSSRPSSAFSELRILQVIRGLVGGGSRPNEQMLGELVERVSPVEFEDNMRELHSLARSNDVSVIDLAFPMLEPAQAHFSRVEALDGLFFAPQLPDTAFFGFDQVHLTSQGNEMLARELAAPVMEILGARVGYVE